MVPYVGNRQKFLIASMDRMVINSSTHHRVPVWNIVVIDNILTTPDILSTCASYPSETMGGGVRIW